MKYLKTIVASILSVILCIVPFLTFEKEQAQGQREVITLWNVDCFEGGVGSRTDFLAKAAKKFSKKENVIFLVTSHTVESAERMLGEGELPDLISYGPSLVGIVPAIETKIWAYGKYILYSLQDNFDDVKNVVLSKNNDTLPELAAKFMSISGTIELSLSAYVHFTSGKYDYLLGTQRDFFRLTSSNRTFFYRECNEFTDMIEYISLCNEEHSTVCRRYIEFLCSDETQKEVKKIGLYNADFTGFDDTHIPVRLTLPTGCGREGIEELRKRADTEDEKLLKNALKVVDS